MKNWLLNWLKFGSIFMHLLLIHWCVSWRESFWLSMSSQIKARSSLQIGWEKKWTKWRDKDFKNLQKKEILFKLRMLKGPVFILWSFTYRSHWVIVGPFMSIWVYNLKDKPWHKKVWKTSFVIIYQFN